MPAARRNWNFWQDVLIEAVDDVYDEAEGELAHVLHRVVDVSPSDPTYRGVNATVAVSVGWSKRRRPTWGTDRQL
eukprot:SAG22_NODE_106_length_19904_cov_14.387175_2_plen_75_part_00